MGTTLASWPCCVAPSAIVWAVVPPWWVVWFRIRLRLWHRLGYRLCFDWLAQRWVVENNITNRCADPMSHRNGYDDTSDST